MKKRYLNILYKIFIIVGVVIILSGIYIILRNLGVF